MQLAETPEHDWFGYAEGQKSGQLLSDEKTLSVLHMRYAECAPGDLADPPGRGGGAARGGHGV